MRVLAGPGIWFVCFSILYALATAACIGLIGTAHAVTSWGVTLASVAALIWIAAFGIGRDGSDTFTALLTRLLAIVSLIGTLWLLLPLGTLQTC